MRSIQIGDKPLRELSAEDLRQMVMIEGCCPGFGGWEDPVVSDFNNTMFGDSCLIEYSSVRKSDGAVSSEYSFHFYYDCGGYFYVKDPFGNPWSSARKRPSLATLRYLIGAGFDVPLY